MEKQNFKIFFRPNIIAHRNKSLLDYELTSFQVNYIQPQTFHMIYDLQRINAYNKYITFKFSGASITLTLLEGNYDLTTFLLMLNSVFSAYTITFTQVNGYIKITNGSGANTDEFDPLWNTTSLNRILGLESNVFIPSVSSATLTRPAYLNKIKFLYVR